MEIWYENKKSMISVEISIKKWQGVQKLLFKWFNYKLLFVNCPLNLNIESLLSEIYQKNLKWINWSPFYSNIFTVFHSDAFPWEKKYVAKKRSKWKFNNEKRVESDFRLLFLCHMYHDEVRPCSFRIFYCLVQFNFLSFIYTSLLTCSSFSERIFHGGKIILYFIFDTVLLSWRTQLTSDGR